MECCDIQKKECMWSSTLDGGSVFSSPAVSTEPHVVIAATLGGGLHAVQPVSITDKRQCLCCILMYTVKPEIFEENLCEGFRAFMT